MASTSNIATMSDDQPAPESWRSAIAQSYRSTEVRSIATVLAELEPGATAASKTMLAMKFEDSIFKAANSLDDYKKTIEKRLKKLRKHYSKQQGVPGGEENDELTREKELLLENELREKFGAKIMYNINKSAIAIQVLRDKGDPKGNAHNLEEHIKRLKGYAVNLGLLNTPKMKMDLARLTKMKEQLEKCCDTIRGHISQICDPELFVLETLAKLEEHFTRRESFSETLRKAFQEKDSSIQFDKSSLERLMDKINAPLPIPRKNEEGGDVKVALAKIEKFRSAAAAIFTFWGLSSGDKTAFSGCTKKCFDVGINCLMELEQEYDALVKELDDTDENGRRIIQLQDAWNNVMQFVDSDADASLDIDEPDAKRQKTEEVKCQLSICSRVLFTPGRALIASIMPVLKRKRATLVTNATAPHVVLEFGKAFEMKVFFVPLLVTIRAMDENSQKKQQIGALGGGLRWPSLHQGLHGSATADEPKQLTVLGVTGSHATLGNIAAKKLEYASSQATLVLRRCFAETVSGKGAVAKTDFEIEILEVGALVKFMSIARSTYIPHWVDDDC